MMGISRTSLFGKLNRLGYQAMENATTFCKMRGNPFVELVHWLHQILNLQNSDLHRIINHFDLNHANVTRDMTEALNRLPMGSTSVQDFSAHVEESIERGWIYGTLMFGDTCVRTGYILVGILETHTLKRVLEGISKEFEKIGMDTLTAQFNQIVNGSPEEMMTASDGTRLGGEIADTAEGQRAPETAGQQDVLRQFSQDLTEKARRGELDPIVGRDDEIRQIVDILMRRRQNNPILTGEAGVGKTAVAEGFALRIAAGDVPPPLQNVTLRALDVGLLQAGASYKGEFEKRLRQVIDAVQSSEKPIILFIDEAHTLVGAGGAAGTGDAANLLKPALARGTLRTIAATTWTEYKKYIEKDPALTRRFQVVQVKEPIEKQAVLMMRSMASVMEQHHRVQVLDEALEASVTLSHRYIPARQLPDKSVSLLDTACARVAISQHAVPAEVDDCRKRIEALETELKIIGRESSVGLDTADREAAASNKLAEEHDRLETLEQRWNIEKDLVE
jgi:type VI secretion system protein VasG